MAQWRKTFFSMGGPEFIPDPRAQEAQAQQALALDQQRLMAGQAQQQADLELRRQVEERLAGQFMAQLGMDRERMGYQQQRDAAADARDAQRFGYQRERDDRRFSYDQSRDAQRDAMSREAMNREIERFLAQEDRIKSEGAASREHAAELARQASTERGSLAAEARKEREADRGEDRAFREREVGLRERVQARLDEKERAEQQALLAAQEQEKQERAQLAQATRATTADTGADVFRSAPNLNSDTLAQIAQSQFAKAPDERTLNMLMQAAQAEANRRLDAKDNSWLRSGGDDVLRASRYLNSIPGSFLHPLGLVTHLGLETVEEERKRVFEELQKYYEAALMQRRSAGELDPIVSAQAAKLMGGGR